MAHQSKNDGANVLSTVRNDTDKARKVSGGLEGEAVEFLSDRCLEEDQAVWRIVVGGWGRMRLECGIWAFMDLASCF